MLRTDHRAVINSHSPIPPSSWLHLILALSELGSVIAETENHSYPLRIKSHMGWNKAKTWDLPGTEACATSDPSVCLSSWPIGCFFLPVYFSPCMFSLYLPCDWVVYLFCTFGGMKRWVGPSMGLPHITQTSCLGSGVGLDLLGRYMATSDVLSEELWRGLPFKELWAWQPVPSQLQCLFWSPGFPS